MAAVTLSIDAVAKSVAGARVFGDGARAIQGIFQDSRRVEAGSLFAVRRGEKSDGKAFVADAIARGAAGIVTDDETLARSSNVPSLLVADVRSSIAPLSAILYGKPFDSLQVIGITGTNGKTTTSYLVSGMLSGLGIKAATLGTLGVRFGDLEVAGQHTTPEADDLARTAATLVEAGATHLAMEVSSHALSLGRVEAVPFRVAAITNLSHDHLDFHGTLDAYGEAKKRLFRDLSPKASVLNLDDPFAASLESSARGEIVRVSGRGAERADLRAVRCEIAAGGIRASISVRGEEIELASPLTGAHNLENLMVAGGIAVALGLDAREALVALGNAPSVPGRLEKVSTQEDDVLALVDYAHTPDALTRVLAAVRPLVTGRVICVFGCGGDRDPMKRAPMGEAAAKAADELYVTNDNPRSESPEAIAAAILVGVKSAGKQARVVLDRAEAIDLAIKSANAGDAVVIAGKGHEPYQIIGGITRAFDDRKEARLALATRRGAR
jgi:UDP-N-acetylmuramoyl-L-alanyl-D-glutamate--2,6-diaminopimelate ligase